MNDPEFDRSLIDAARDAMGPTDEERARLLKRTLVAVGSAAASGAAASGAAAASAGSVAGTGGVVVAGTTVATWKIVAVVAGLAVAGGTTAWQMRGPANEAERPGAERTLAATESAVESASSTAVPSRAGAGVPSSEAPAQATPAQATPTSVTPAQAPVDPHATTARSEHHDTPRVQRAPHAHPSEPAASPRADPPTVTAAGRLGAEAALLRSAHAALQAGRAGEAIRRLDEHRRTYPNGALQPERTATRVLALCELGQAVEARRIASAFLRTHPNSMQANRIRSSCAAP